MSTSLITMNGWQPELPATTYASRQAMLDALAAVTPAGDIPDGPIGQMTADAIAAELARCKTWQDEGEAFSKAMREPYFNTSKLIKQTWDEFAFAVVQAAQRAGDKLGEFEAAKKTAEITVNRQRSEDSSAAIKAETERRIAADDAILSMPIEERQSAAHVEMVRRESMDLSLSLPPATYAAPQTAGVRVKVVYEFQVINQRQFTEWCWANGKAWVNEITFFKRDVTSYLNSPDADLAIPGLMVKQVVDSKVRKAKATPTLNVGSIKTEL